MGIFVFGWNRFMVNPQLPNEPYDLLIVGSGMVGASLSAALSPLNLRCLLIDKQIKEFDQTQRQPELRVSSISKGSIDWLQQKSIWSELNQNRLNYYQSLSINEQSKNHCEFNAKSLALENLGCFVENSHLRQAALNQNNYPLIEASIDSCQFQQSLWQVKLSNGETIQTKLIIAADGGQSKLRQLLNFPQHGWQYPQACYSAMVKLNQPVNMQQTWQTFNQGSAIAFLPLFDNYASLIVYQSNAKIRQLLNLNLAEQSKQLTSLFQNKIADFTLLQSASFPLQKMSVINPIKQGVILVGDAAHTIHPLAGQGVNLGIRDIAQVVSLIEKNLSDITQLQQQTHWQKYIIQRNIDVQSMSAMMDLTYYTFNSHNPILSWLRNQTLTNVNHIAPLKKIILKLALGAIRT